MNKSQVIKLIGINQQDKRLYLTEEGKSFLQNIDGPISIISIAGLYRTGKSFLVNELLQKLNHNEKDQKHKFQVGSTVQSCTKGLNVWGVPITSKSSQKSRNKQFSYIIVDSEGIGSMQQQYSYDMNLLMLIFLISSTVIYNSIGAIDEQSLDQLRVVVNLKKSLSPTTSTLLSTTQENHHQLNINNNSQPRLIWVLRDFALQLINKKGQSMTSNEYLEDCLIQSSSNTTNKQLLKKNEIRSAIKACLPNRQCITLQLQILHSLPKHKLRTQFNTQIQTLFQTIFRNQQQDIKYLNNKQNHINGSTLVKMIEYYLSQINTNKIPQIKSLWELILKNKLEEMFDECEGEYKREVGRVSLGECKGEKELGQRLKEIQVVVNEKYQKLLSQMNDITVYKQFMNHFSRITTHINTKTIKSFKQSLNKKVIKHIRTTINKHIQFDKIDPCSLTQIKQAILQAMKIKNIVQLQQQAYQYLLSTVFDIMQIAQQKTLTIKNQLNALQQSNNQAQKQKVQKDQELIRLKQTYHQTLKQISSIKTFNVDGKQQLAVLKQQFQLLQQKCHCIIKQKQQKQLLLSSKIKQLNQKIKHKHNQSTQSIKQLRQQNNLLILQLQQTKRQLNNYQLQKRKQLIFEDKIKQSWDRFQQQRVYFKQQLGKFKQLYHEGQQKVRLLLQKQQRLQIMLRRQREIYNKKQRQFCQQLKWMKENYSLTKSAYSQSMNTRMQSERILQDVTGMRKSTNNNNNNNHNSNSNNQLQKSNNMTKMIANKTNQDISTAQQINLTTTNNNNNTNNTSNISTTRTQTTTTKDDNSLNNNILVQQLTTTCQTLKTSNQQLHKQLILLKNNLSSQQQLHHQQKLQYSKKLTTIEQQYQQLITENQSQKQHFYTCLKQLQHSKQDQRQIYQQSIMRLINNIEAIGSSSSGNSNRGSSNNNIKSINKKYLS